MQQVTTNHHNSSQKKPLFSVLATVAALGLSVCMLTGCQEPIASNSASGSSAKMPIDDSVVKSEGSSTVDGSMEKVQKTDAEWRDQLSPGDYQVTRNKGTERPFTGKYWDNKADGTYVCKCCDLPLFDSSTKFKSGTGWPSFFKTIDDKAVTDISDRSYGMVRTENTCSRCDAHLGHVFNDGPAPTGLRYCMNSASLKFLPAKKEMESEVETPDTEIPVGSGSSTANSSEAN